MSIGARNTGIDLIRGVSILLVLLHHFNIQYRLAMTPLADLLSPWLVRAICRNGNYGVTMFFTISGFLITSNAIRRWGRLRDVAIPAFYALRAARILPCLLLLLAIVNVLGLSGIPMFANHSETGPPISWALADLAALTFWMNVLMAHAGWFNYCLGVLWSLSVEEVFYITFPLICALLRRDRLIIAFWLVVILIGPAYRLAHQHDDAGFLYAYFACFDAIAIGCCTALLMRRVPLSAPTARRLPWLVVPAMAALYLYRSIGDTNVWGVTAMSLGTASLLLSTTFQPAPAPRQAIVRAVGWIGQHSYELYMFHLIVLATIRTLLPPDRLTPPAALACLVLYLTGSLGLSALIAHRYADPANRTVRRLLTRHPVPA